MKEGLEKRGGGEEERRRGGEEERRSRLHYNNCAGKTGGEAEDAYGWKGNRKELRN